MDRTLFRKIFRVLNKYFMVPMFRMGLGHLIVSPFSGYIMVMKTTGRKSGRPRYAPVNYAIHKGCIYCLAGFGSTSDWYMNMKSQPAVDVLLPGRSFSGIASDVSEHAERVQVARQILISAGFAGYFEGYNPRKLSPEEVEKRIDGRPIIRIQPVSVANGPQDYGGWAWAPTQLAIILIPLLIIIALLVR